MKKRARRRQRTSTIVRELIGEDVPVVEQPFTRPGSRAVRAAARALPGARAAKRPGGAVDRADIPKTLDDLPAAQNRAYELTLSRAGELSIPVAGSLGAGDQARIVVLERTAYATIRGADDAADYLYGYAIRLCVTVSKWDASLKVSLPFLAASAQIGQAQASWTLQVLGLSGPKIAGALAPPTELNVETFVLAKQSLTALIDAVYDATTKFSAQRLAVVTSEDARDDALRLAAVRTYALSRLARRSSLPEALSRLGSSDPLVSAAVTEVYQQLEVADGQRPSDRAARKAFDLLGRIQADV